MDHCSPSLRTVALSAAVAACASAAPAQCARVWVPQSPFQLVTAFVHAIAETPDGALLVGGAFTTPGGAPGQGLMHWSGGVWTVMDPGVQGTLPSFWAPTVRALLALPDGSVIVGGAFTSAGGTPAGCVARWHPAGWSSLGAGCDGPVHALARLPGGDLVAGGAFATAGGVAASGIARWNGLGWSPLGAGIDGEVHALAVLPDGDLVAGGSFTAAGGVTANHVARWDGSGWAPVGSGMAGGNGGLVFGGADLVASLLVQPDGGLVAGGYFATAGGVPAASIARWDGLAWSPLGAGLGQNPATAVRSLVTLPGGDLAAAGTAANVIQRWRNGAWESLMPAMTGTYGIAGIQTMRVTDGGDLLVGGFFLGPVSQQSPSFVRVVTTCPAGAVDHAAGCTGSGGPNLLAPTALPWLGDTFCATATGMPANALALAVFGFTPIAVPMPLVIPQGVAGCIAAVSPDFVDVRLAAAGLVTTELTIPDAAALVGLQFRHQVQPLEVDPQLHILALTSTNALTLTIGVF